jgi:intracellular multiplication protein IcmB
MRYAKERGIIDSVFYLFDTLFQGISDTLIKQNPRSFIDVNTVGDENTLVFKDGTLVSIIAIDGALESVLADEYEAILDGLDSKFRSYLADGTHFFSWYFSVDDDKIGEEIDRCYGDNARNTARNIGLDCDDFIDEQTEVLKRYCHLERNLLVLHTTTRKLTREEQAQIKT